MPFAQENTRKYYADNRELAEDIAAGYKKFIADIYAAGCRDLQFDDCSWGMLVDPLACTLFDTDEKGLKAIKEQLLELNNMSGKSHTKQRNRILLFVGQTWKGERTMGIREEIKSYIVRSGMTMTEVVDRLYDDYDWSRSVPNLSGKLRRGSLRYQEAVELADVLDYDIVWVKRKR